MSASLNVLGIYREEMYSNRAVAADKAILDEVLKVVAQMMGDKVFITKVRPEDKALRLLDYDWDLVFSMAQDKQILHSLDLLEARGTVVVNSGKAVRNCYRAKLSEMLSDKDFSYPQYVSIDVNDVPAPIFESTHGYWVKRGDFHALVDEDVVHVESIDELGPILLDFQNRGVNKVILQKNCQGELFKFYGVRDRFFTLRYMGKTTTDRYSLIAGNPDIAFDRKHLEKIVQKAANVLELDYFGGDCIITETGEMHLIDFNDWPSFRTCRKNAAQTMASYALDKFRDEVTLDCRIAQRI